MTTQHNEIIWLIMRRMRTPLVLLIITLSLSVLGLVLVPGLDDQGQPYYMSFLDAIYFVAFMSTTIGFGEIPYEFTDAQRLLVLFSIFSNVTIWLYSIGAILALVQDPRFDQALTRFRFARNIARMREPFYILCGCGDTGFRVLEGLTERDIACVVVDIESEQIDKITLGRNTGHVPAVEGDAQIPETLKLCGLLKTNCIGVAALTNDDETNLTVAMSCKLLSEDKVVLCRSEDTHVTDNMASFNTNVIIDPYQRFARRLALSLIRPRALQVQEWLTALPDSNLKDITAPPHGLWIICGMGRLGQALLDNLTDHDIDLSLVDINDQRLPVGYRSVLGRGTGAKALKAAGVSEAVGIVAATNHDIDNLSIIVTARELNPSIHTVVRQNYSRYDPLFENCGADLVASRHKIIAREILTEMSNPLIRPFLDFAAQRSESWNHKLQEKLSLVLNNRAPDLWSIKLDSHRAKPVDFCISRGLDVFLDDILRDPRDRKKSISCIALIFTRDAERRMLPAADQKVQPGDEILFCGTPGAHRLMLWSLREPHVLHYNVTGKDLPRGALMRWVSR